MQGTRSGRLLGPWVGEGEGRRSQALSLEGRTVQGAILGVTWQLFLVSSDQVGGGQAQLFRDRAVSLSPGQKH